MNIPNNNGKTEICQIEPKAMDILICNYIGLK